MPNHELDWCVVVFAKSERRRLGRCLESLSLALRGYDAHTVIIINGATDGTAGVAASLIGTLELSASLYTIPYACKSHAINVFIEELRRPSKYCLFVDGTAFVEPEAIREMEAELDTRKQILAVSGLPINGRGAKKMRSDAEKSPRLFGQMFAVRGEFLDALISLGRRLPVGLYRGDGLFCGFICWETNGVSHEYAAPRIATVPTARWRIEPISLIRLTDLKVGFKRMVRQARGRLENQAWNSIVWSKGFGALPQFADDMILDWLKTARPAREGPLSSVFTAIALRQVRASKRPTPEELRPTRQL